MRFRLQLFLGTCFLLLFPAHLLAGDPPEYTVSVVQYGPFQHHILGPQMFGMVVIEPTNPDKNGAAVVTPRSGGFVSGDAQLIAQDPNLAVPLFPYLKKGYTMFIPTHGNKYNMLANPPTPGWTFAEIVEQIARSVRYIKVNAQTYGIDPEKICATGGSSSGVLALSLLVGDVGDPTSPNFDPAFDNVSSQVACAFVSAVGTDGCNLRFTGDKGYFWRYGELLFHPDLTGHNMPAPPLLLPGMVGPGDTGIFEDNMGTPTYPDYHELNYNSMNNELEPPEDHPYPPMPTPQIAALASSPSLLDLLDQQTGPSHLICGTFDWIAPIHSARLWKRKCDQIGVECTLIERQDEGHSWRNLNREQVPVSIAFMEKHLFGSLDSDADCLPDSDEGVAGTEILDRDTDGDGASDKEEVEVGTDPLDPLSVFRIGLLEQMPNSNLSGWDLNIHFLAKDDASYKLQVSPELEEGSWRDVAGVAPLYIPLGTAFGTFTIPDAHLTVPGSTFYRVVQINPDGLNCFHTKPFGRTAIRIHRNSSMPAVSYVGDPLPHADLVQAEVASVSGQTITLKQAVLPPGLGLDLLGQPNYAVFVTLDEDLVPPEKMPWRFGAEGHWFPILSNTSDSVTVELREPLSGLEDVLHDNVTVAVRKLSSVRDLFGNPHHPAPFFIAQENDEIELHREDDVLRLRLMQAFGFLAWHMDFGGVWINITDADSIKIFPDEVLVFTAVPQSNAQNVMLQVAGQVPAARIHSYLDRPEAGESPLVNFRSWPYPVNTNLDTQGTLDPLIPVDGPRGSYAGLHESGFGGDENLDLLNRLHYTQPHEPGHLSDDQTLLSLLPYIDEGHAIFTYWLRPKQVTYSFQIGGGSASIASLYAGRGYRLDMAQSGNGKFVWIRPMPYKRP